MTYMPEKKAIVLHVSKRQREKMNEENEWLSNPFFESILLVLDCTYEFVDRSLSAPIEDPSHMRST